MALSIVMLLLFIFSLLQGLALPVSNATDTSSATVSVDTIYFRNPSFEGKAGAAVVPDQWINPTPGSTPDILPGAWNLSVTPVDGKTCLGLVCRDDGTSEDIGQVLTDPLMAGECYEFYAWLCRLPKYVGHNQACQLRIYGGDKGSRSELLAQSPLISSSEWAQYRFQFTPKTKHSSISLVVWYGPGVLFKYNGNILVDHLSPIVRCDRA